MKVVVEEVEEVEEDRLALVVEEAEATVYVRLKESVAVSLVGAAPIQSIVVAAAEEDRLALVVEGREATVYVRLKESVAVSLDGVE